MAPIEAYGLAVGPIARWEARIYRRPEQGELASAEVAGAPAPTGELTYPVMHVATVALPIDMADYGSDVVTDLRSRDALIVLKEFDPADSGQPLFARTGIPRRLEPTDFDPAALQRRLAGQAGHQTFFNQGGRAFCLYVVLGAYAQRAAVVPEVNQVLASIAIDPVAPEALRSPMAQSTGMTPPPSSTTSTTTSTTAPSAP